MTGERAHHPTASPEDGDLPLGLQRRARRLAWVYLIVAAGSIVWTVFLALSLPRENLEHHYRLTWAGFDLIEVLAIYLTAHMAFRLDARVIFPATVVATLLAADAWFDVTTSATGQAAIGQDWWSLGLEATGPAGLLRGTLEATAAFVFARPIPSVAEPSPDESRSYAEWLSDLDRLIVTPAR